MVTGSSRVRCRSPISSGEWQFHAARFKVIPLVLKLCEREDACHILCHCFSIGKIRVIILSLPTSQSCCEDPNNVTVLVKLNARQIFTIELLHNDLIFLEKSASWQFSSRTNL